MMRDKAKAPNADSQLDLFAEIEAAEAELRLAQAPTLFDTAERGVFARLEMFEQWVAEYGNFGCKRLSHGWRPTYTSFRGDRPEPTDRCRPILLDAELRCDHYGDSCLCVGDLLYRAACLHCTFEGTIRDCENAASEDAQDHCFPGWRDLPIVAQVPEYGSGASGKKAMTNWIAKVETLYPTGWLQEGGPIRTRRTAPGTRHVPLRTPFGGYDMCGEITPNKTRTTTPTTSQEER